MVPSAHNRTSQTASNLVQLLLLGSLVGSTHKSHKSHKSQNVRRVTAQHFATSCIGVKECPLACSANALSKNQAIMTIKRKQLRSTATELEYHITNRCVAYPRTATIPRTVL